MKNCVQTLVWNKRFRFLSLFILLLAVSLSAFSQVSYRTFSQFDLSQKKARAGKAIGSSVCFTFRNTTDSTVNDLHARFNAGILTIEDAGGFSTIDISRRGKVIDARGLSISPGDSVMLCATFKKKAPGTKINYWWWTKDGNQVGPKNENLFSTSDFRIRTQPNAGNIMKFLYRYYLPRPEAMVLGIPTDTPDVGWIRYMKGHRRQFYHTGTPRCFDYITRGRSGRVKDFDGQVRNPKVKKHDNHLVGELHALKLAIVANDSGVTEPVDSGVTLFGDLIYQDSLNVGDPCNGLTIRQIAHLADSALTYCGHFDSAFYLSLDSCVSRINVAFGGDYTAVTFSPLLIAGTQSLAAVPFLKPNPAPPPTARPLQPYALDDALPEGFKVHQNYPNPFNPTTTIEFNLDEPSIVTVKIYDVLGREVTTLINRAELSEGEHWADFDATVLPSGVYFYRLLAQGVEDNANPHQVVKRMILLK